jgi:cyclic peptide transporter
MSVFLHYLSKRKALLALATLLSAVSASLSIVLVGYINDLATGGLEQPGRALLEVVGLITVTFLLNGLSQTYLASFGASAIAELRRDLSERFLRLDHEQMRAIGKHRVVGSLIADVGRIATLLMVLPLFVFNLALALFCLGWLLLVSPSLFLVFALFMGFAVGSSLYLALWSGGLALAIREEEDALFESFRALADGKKELSLSEARAEHFLGVVLEGSVERNRVLSYSAQKWWNFSSNWANTMIFCALFTIVFVGDTWLGADGGTVVQFVLGTLFLMNPLSFMITASQDVTLGLASARKVSDLGIDMSSPLPALLEPPSWTVLKARELVYRYPHDEFVLGPVDLAITRGEILFLVGGNGSGKSTLALLLAGLARPSGGHIELDGRRVEEEELPGYRQLFTAVFSDFYLFRHPVDRAGACVPDERVNALLERMALSDKVTARDGALSTLELSQGQRKRLAMVQCYLDDADIYLFDEWAADQDPEFRAYFYTELLPELKARGRTVIAVTHDDRYFGCADRIVVLERGQLVERQRPVTVAVG